MTELNPNEEFLLRHIGPRPHECKQMLSTLGLRSLDELISKTIPHEIQNPSALTLKGAVSESQVLSELRGMAKKNKVLKNFIGCGYHGTITPGVILRNVMEDPGWYTQYTPYQAEISQGRLEALVNFQTMVMELTGFTLANASLLDEATAAAEAMTMAKRVSKNDGHKFFASEDCHPQTLAVLTTRAKPLGIEVVVGKEAQFHPGSDFFGVIIQYPGTLGQVVDHQSLIANCKSAGLVAILATDLLALTLLKTPAELGADVAIGNTQRFGVALGFGGPHAAFMATHEELKRQVPGRIVGISKDKLGRDGYRLALQTREQHIRRDKASSNICTAQVLLAVMASMYAVYHGPEGLKKIASRIHMLTRKLADGLKQAGFRLTHQTFFDTLTVETSGRSDEILRSAEGVGINLRRVSKDRVGIALDETANMSDVIQILKIFGASGADKVDGSHQLSSQSSSLLSSQLIFQWPSQLNRQSEFMKQNVFKAYQSEHEMLRYLHRLKSKDLSLTASMIPLGSCTMKLNSSMEMAAITWPEFSDLHPFCPPHQSQGYQELFTSLESMLSEITGFPAFSLQPNAGSQGEYAGLLAIMLYHESRGHSHRRVCLIPQSAHGTNPASAVMAGMKVIVVQCDSRGNIDISDLEQKVLEHSPNLAAIMVTYPSTHGVFEEEIRKICTIIHHHGGQVYMDGANMNAQVGICRPADYGADVLHLNLHKTFCIPHGGGGPGMGPIGVQSHLKQFLPSHPLIKVGGDLGPVSAAPWGSASILPISWAYIRAMGAKGLRLATEIAILNANYIAHRLDKYYPVLYRGKNGFVAHECIIDFRDIKDSSGVEVEDVAKRLMDYGFHAPTVSFPVAGTMMIEPTESESLQEIERFCVVMIQIREEISTIEKGRWPKDNNPLKNAPHTTEMVAADQWSFAYSREIAAFPLPSLREYKFWPAVARIDNVYGDRNLVCSCS